MDNINVRDARRTEGSGVRISRPDSFQEPLVGAPMGAEPEGDTLKPRRSGRGAWILAGTIIVVLVVLGVVFRDRLIPGGASQSGLAAASYQAVFLTNGQVYFGKLSEKNDRYLSIENIYYLQVTPVLQTKTEGEAGAPAVQGQEQQQQQQLSLVKLGNELHGPVDKMFINRDQVLFFEDLKDDGRVVQAIKNFEEQQKK